MVVRWSESASATFVCSRAREISDERTNGGGRGGGGGAEERRKQRVGRFLLENAREEEQEEEEVEVEEEEVEEEEEEEEEEKESETEKDFLVTVTNGGGSSIAEEGCELARRTHRGARNLMNAGVREPSGLTAKSYRYSSSSESTPSVLVN
ncbi:hypothetical protein HZH68_002376 [Vespula germanica]|uniref:Uncharacterized protein n=1 Tax=Vespula germanica TaxID=30212 RepID=A0A834NM69_VESGE|nr:hypothetical protein HZH68_002376 [Vespula germanica]